jgi:hypothetical protein
MRATMGARLETDLMPILFYRKADICCKDCRTGGEIFTNSIILNKNAGDIALSADNRLKNNNIFSKIFYL